MRGELGDSARDQDTYSLLSLPVLSDEVVLGALSLITFRRHDRYGRAELAVLEEYAARAGRAIRIVLDLEQLRRDAREAISHREIQHDTIRALEGGVAALRDEVRLLRAENAALRAPRDEQGNGAGSLAADVPATVATDERPSPPDRASAPDRPVVATAVAEAAAPAARQQRSTLRRTPKSAPVVPAPV
jgi:GAF domain-containing protein